MIRFWVKESLQSKGLYVKTNATPKNFFNQCGLERREVGQVDRKC